MRRKGIHPIALLESEQRLTCIQYGRVERVYIDRKDQLPKVFVKFTSQLSA